MVIGIMGGIGSGKTEVCNYMEEKYNAFVIDSDEVAKEVMRPGTEVFDEVVKEFPSTIRNEEFDPSELAKIVFNDREKLAKLNELTHPLVIENIKEKISLSNADIIVLESALFVGTNLKELCDELWFIFCNKEVRIDRLMVTRDYSRDKAVSIINSQPTDDEYNLIADEFIDNSDDFKHFQEQIDYVMEMMQGEGCE